MVRTRSHKTFDDDDEVQVQKVVNIGKSDILEIGESEKEDKISESEEDSDDAPEEESLSVTKQNMKKKQTEQEKILKERRAQVKAKHREHEERRKAAKLEQEIKKLEKQKKKIQSDEDEVFDELPEDLLQNIEFSAKDEAESRNKKIVFNDTEEDKRINKLNKRRKREERLNSLRQLNAKNEKEVEGGIYIKILKGKNSGNISNAIGNKRDEWLNRKRIRRE